MIEYLIKANEELKRADHLVYVTLKYTRTTDVIMNTLDRIVNALNNLADVLFEYCKEKRLVKKEFDSPKEKINSIKKAFKNNKEIIEFLKFYSKIKKLSRTKYQVKEEYRRHVGIIVKLNKKEYLIDIDELKEIYLKSLDYFALIKRIVT